MSMTNLLRVGVSALAMTFLAGAAMAQDVTEGEVEIVEEWVEDGTVVDDGEVILIDDICIDCSGIPDEGDITGGEDGGSEEPIEYLEDGAGGDDGVVYDDGEGEEPVLFPTSNCGGCEAWMDRGDDLSPAADPRPLSLVYRQALCSDPAFAHVSACEGLPLN